MSAIALASPEKDAVFTVENDARQNIKDKKFDAFQKMLATDFHGVCASEINKADKEVAGIQALDVKSTVLLSTQIAARDQSRTDATPNDIKRQQMTVSDRR